MAEVKKNVLTYEGLKKYEEELTDLKVNKRKEIADKYEKMYPGIPKSPVCSRFRNPPTVPQRPKLLRKRRKPKPQTSGVILRRPRKLSRASTQRKPG